MSRGDLPLDSVDGVEALSDVELVRAALALDASFGCSLWLVGLLLGASVGSVWGMSGAVLGMLGAGALCAVVQRLRELLPGVRKARLAEREFEMRFELAPLEQHETKARAELEGPDAPEAVLLFTARALPHGGHRFIRIDLAPEARIRVRSTPLLHNLRGVDDLQASMLKFDQTLPGAAADRIRALLRELTPEKLVAPSLFVRDGFPCSAVVLRSGADRCAIDALSKAERERATRWIGQTLSHPTVERPPPSQMSDRASSRRPTTCPPHGAPTIGTLLRPDPGSI